MDGTLYDATAVRHRMAVDLARAHLRRPARAARIGRVLQAYRSALEDLRDEPRPDPDLAGTQIARAAATLGASTDEVAGIVAQWFEQAPLRHVASAGVADRLAAFGRLRDRGVAVAVVSDYEPHAKLVALGLDGMVDVAVSGRDPAVGRLKPDPAAFAHVRRSTGLDDAPTWVIGDRPDVDGVAAAADGAHFLAFRCRGTLRSRRPRLAAGVVEPLLAMLRTDP